MYSKIFVEVTTSDKVTASIPISTDLAQLTISRNRIRETIKQVLFSELWKKVAIHGWNSHYDIQIPVKYDELRISYVFSIPATYAIEVRGDVMREIMNKTAEIEHHIAYVITHMQK